RPRLPGGVPGRHGRGAPDRLLGRAAGRGGAGHHADPCRRAPLAAPRSARRELPARAGGPPGCRAVPPAGGSPPGAQGSGSPGQARVGRARSAAPTRGGHDERAARRAVGVVVSTRAHVIIVIIAVVAFAFILRLVSMRQLRSKYALLWLVIGFALL